MSDPNNPAAPAAKTRPGSVTISSYLLFLVAAIFVINSIISLSTMGTASDVVRDAYAGTSMEGSEGFVTAFTAVGVVLNLLLAAAFVVLGLFNNRGRNGSRITTWVLAVIGVCCTGLGLGDNALNSMNTGSAGEGPSSAELADRLNEAMPGWVGPVETLLNVIALIALLAAVVLLALPPSNEFFRKTKAAWEPPVPGAAYPGYPQSPQGGEPGSPQTPGSPQNPGYPQNPPAGDPGYPPPPGGSDPDSPQGPSSAPPTR